MKKQILFLFFVIHCHLFTGQIGNKVNTAKTNLKNVLSSKKLSELKTYMDFVEQSQSLNHFELNEFSRSEFSRDLLDGYREGIFSFNYLVDSSVRYSKTIMINCSIKFVAYDDQITRYEAFAMLR